MKDPLNIPRVSVVKDRPLTEIEVLRKDIREMISHLGQAPSPERLSADQRLTVIVVSVICGTALAIALAIVQGCIHG